MTESIAELHTDTEELVPSTQTVYLIGDDNCQFNTIVQILKPEQSTSLHQKLIDVAIDLNIPGGRIAQWRLEIRIGNLSNDILLYEILEQFRSKYAEEATLIKFINALCKKDLFQEAENLATHFGINLETDEEFVQLKSNKRFWFIFRYGASILFTTLVIGLICLFVYLRTRGNDYHNKCLISPMINEEIHNTTIQWAKNIENSSVSEIYKILHNCDFSDKTSLLLSDSVDMAFNGDIKKFAPVLKFVSQIYLPMYQYTGYAALLASMQENQQDYTSEMIKLVYFIKVAMEDKNSGSELREKYKNLIKSVVKEIRAIIFRECLKIRNYNEYMILNEEKSVGYLQMTAVLVKVEDTEESKLHWYFDVGYERDQIIFKVSPRDFPDTSSICPSLDYFNNRSKNTIECYPVDQPDVWWVVTPAPVQQYRNQFTIKRRDGCPLFSLLEGVEGIQPQNVLTLAEGCDKPLFSYGFDLWNFFLCSEHSS